MTVKCKAEMIDGVHKITATCECLLEGMSISEAARRAGIKRATFYQNIIEPLREAFREADLEGYF